MTLQNLAGIKWIGDLSLQDADILAQYAQGANVLEFGVGGSTMIFAQTAKTLVSVDTSERWLGIIQERLFRVAEDKPINCDIRLLNYEKGRYRRHIEENNFDLIFVDGILPKRLRFVLSTWNLLNYNGHLLIHDTRAVNIGKATKTVNEKLIPSLYAKHFIDIGTLQMNLAASDGKRSYTTLIKKEKLARYVNWQTRENKPAWSYGSDISVNDLWEYKPEE